MLCVLFIRKWHPLMHSKAQAVHSTAPKLKASEGKASLSGPLRGRGRETNRANISSAQDIKK